MKVEQALAHIVQLHPQVTTVIYDEYLRWGYVDDAGGFPAFTGAEDISLLEAAADEAYERGLILTPIKLK
jgi:hypothetical protein